MHYEIENAINLQKCADYYVGLGAEGIMVRDPNGKYKYGRSTEKEGGLLKYKPFLDGEAIIIDFVEQMHNDNEPELDALGLMKRSKHQANLSAAGKLGAFICQFADMSKPDIVFNVGTGFTDAQRIEYWNNRSKYLGKIFNFKYQNLTAENKPRIPSFKGFRLD
jgi:DNA ligase-1